MARDPEKVRRYKEAANRIKNLQPGTPEYERNSQILKTIGTEYGFNFQNDFAQWEKDKAGAPQPVGPQGIPKSIDNVTEGIQADANAQGWQADQNIRLNNPDVNNPFGNQKVTRDANGNITVDQNLSGDQQAILDQDEELTKLGNDMAQTRLKGSGLGEGWNPNLTEREKRPDMLTQPFNPNARASFGTGDLQADRTRVEDAIFKSLTRNVDRSKDEERKSLEQTLYNRGIPLDPTNPIYAKSMRDLNERYDGIKENAMNNAAIQGGQEYRNMFDIGETGRANDVSQASAIRGQNFDEYQTNTGIAETQRANDVSLGSAVRGQNLAEIGGLSNLGTGLQTPNFQPFQGSQIQLTSPTAIDSALAAKSQGQQGVDIQRKAANAQAQALKAQAARAGGGARPPAQPAQPAPPPFS